MSEEVFFGFAVGLSKDLYCPKGTFEHVCKRVEWVEKKLALKTTKYLNNPKHWANEREAIEAATDDIACEAVEQHNDFVRAFYVNLERWYDKPIEDGEVITPKMAQKFWHGLELLTVPLEKWTGEYYLERSRHLYDVMRTGESEGSHFDAPTLSIKQAAAVILLFSKFLDKAAMDLEVPVGHDYLWSGYRGDYHWCDTCCKPIHQDDMDYKAQHCHRKNCELRDVCGLSRKSKQ